MAMQAMFRHRARRGFTMIELVVVMAVLGLLVTLALPRYMAALDRGREQVLAHNLALLRQAIDRYAGDRGVFPDRLEDLVDKRYLRAVPLNPFTEQADWVIVLPPVGQKGGVYDVKPAATASRPLPMAAEPEAAPAGEGPGEPAREAQP